MGRWGLPDIVEPKLPAVCAKPQQACPSSRMLVRAAVFVFKGPSARFASLGGCITFCVGLGHPKGTPPKGGTFRARFKSVKNPSTNKLFVTIGIDPGDPE